MTARVEARGFPVRDLDAGPDAPALYSVAAPFASYLAGAVVATGRRSIA